MPTGLRFHHLHTATEVNRMHLDASFVLPLFYLFPNQLCSYKTTFMATSIAKVFRRDKMKEGKAPVYIRITKNRKTSYIATTLRLEERHWDDKQKKVKPSYPNSAQANTY